MWEAVSPVLVYLFVFVAWTALAPRSCDETGAPRRFGLVERGGLTMMPPWLAGVVATAVFMRLRSGG